MILLLCTFRSNTATISLLKIVMKSFKAIFFLFAGVVFTNISLSQAKSPIKTSSSKDSTELANYLQKIRKELLTKEVLKKYDKSEPLKTLTLVYGDKIILTTAKND